ncbi:TonB-dependent receptor [Adhaeribacter arboris]|uniref:TonB-dependent receptor n=1 Tax=Adhaeribacter arboris TaxID=2072846 RepID=A0A2T2YCI8_9BACT|nr:TonB-dependent receptor [Adhaeribacter arboris]PSR53214.1 TonB-dependent receptor [Adhaeribacter arboris]
MVYFYRGLCSLFLFISFGSLAQTQVTLSGNVLDYTTQKPIPFASIRLKETRVGVSTSAKGNFVLKAVIEFPVTLLVSSVGYQTLEQIITAETNQVFYLNPQSVLANEVVISASRREERRLESPITIEQLDAKALRESPAPTFFDALESVKGLQMTTASLGFKVPNTRGFTNPTNVRFLQLVDGVDNQAPVIGASIANAVGPTELDVERLEVIPGTASALYGINSLNGLVSFFTKNPFDFQGLSVYQRTGLNHLNDSQTKPHVLSETALRYAKVIHSKLAFKVNLAYFKGFDWIANQQQDLNPKANASVNLLGDQNPALDPVSSYGNESSNRRTLSLNGKNYVVARTGYYEKDITDYQLQNLKADLALHYRFTDKLEASYQYKIGQLDNVYQRTNRFKLNDYRISQQVLQLKSPVFQLRTYYTREVSGKSYNIRSLAENLDKQFKSDNTWFKDYSTRFLNSQQQGISLPESHQLARSFADQGRFQPGTVRYDSAVAQITNINNWDMGAALRTKASLFHAEGQYDFTSAVKWVNLLVGFDYRLYSVFPDGNYFINPVESGENVLYRKGGGFAQLSKKLLNDNLQLNVALRYDKNEYFKGIFNPRFSAVYNLQQKHFWRISYQNGYRFPSLFEAFSNVNSGGVKRVGGLRLMSNGIFEDSYIRSSIDAFQAAVNQDVNQKSVPLAQAITNRASLLKKSPYDYIQPERINSLELGYKGLYWNDRLLVDGDFYFNFYNHFIAQVEVNQISRRTVTPDSIPFYFYDKSKQDRYRLWTNSSGTVYNYGSSLGVKYNFWRQFTFSGNLSYAKLYRKKFNDGLEEAFNTPQWISNVSLGNPKIFKNVGFQVNWHWQDAFLWQSSLGTGPVPAYHNLDAQVSFRVPQLKLQWKVGGTNILNQYYNQMVAGPSIGGLYYVSVVFDELL